tara:strand:- start:1658 stop:2059 length:402 start_codon:yes stop_codon:yes gene_type:complete
MANLLNSSQPKWLYFQESANIITVPIGENPQLLSVKSAAQGSVTVALHQAGHTGTLPAVTANKDATIKLVCANGDEAFIIQQLMRWIVDAGTSAIASSNQRFLEIVGTTSTITSLPARFNSKITGIDIQFDAN